MERLNNVTLIGNIGKVTTGEKSLYFSLALNESFKPKDSDEWVEKTVWLDVICFSQTLDKVKKLGLQIGQSVLVIGKLDMKEYEGKRSIQIIAHKVQPLPNNGRTKQTEQPEEVAYPDVMTNNNDDDDDLPF